MTDPQRLAALRVELARRSLDGFLVPLADEHQGEYVPARARRLKWLTGFSGSAGVAVVLTDAATIFVDGRYTLQVREEVDVELFEPRHLIEEPPDEWLGDHLPKDARLGYDPWLHTVDAVAKLKRQCQRAGAELVACDGSPLDACWADQPDPPLEPVQPHDDRWTGKASADKRAEVGEMLADKRADAVVLTDPASIAWLLNVRGGDVECTPLPLGPRARVFRDGIDVIVPSVRRTAPDALSPNAKTHNYLNLIMGDLEVKARDPEAWAVTLDVNGNLCEGMGSNVFILRDGEIITPKVKYVLPGVSRQTAIDLAQEAGITVIEEDISLYDAYNADEMFLTSTSLCLCGVKTVNGVNIGDGSPPGEITKRLTEAYVRLVDFDFVKQYLDRLAA